MSLSDLTADSVREAMKEFDTLGRTAFLAKYGNDRAKDFFIVEDGRYYDSKAIAGAAHGFLSSTSSPLDPGIFSGGEASVRKKLEGLGFVVTGKDTLPFIGAGPGDVLTNNDIVRRFKVGNMGGMRRNANAQHLMLISDPFKALYDDRWEGDVLHYTGEGKIGDQDLIRQNKTLFHSRETGEVVHLFEALENQRYTYHGEVELVADPYQETQPDEDGNPRLVWMFPVKVKEGVRRLPTEQQIRAVAAVRAKRVSKLSDDELEKRAKAAKGKPPRRQVTSVQVARDQSVVEYVKRKADGHCDLCEDAAPFKDKKGKAYLECHHIVPLAKDGEDSIANAVALCPNCHRKMHSLNRASDRKKLTQRVQQRDGTGS